MLSLKAGLLPRVPMMGGFTFLAEVGRAVMVVAMLVFFLWPMLRRGD
jgi:hypothetical protein